MKYRRRFDEPTNWSSPVTFSEMFRYFCEKSVRVNYTWYFHSYELTWFIQELIFHGSFGDFLSSLIFDTCWCLCCNAEIQQVCKLEVAIHRFVNYIKATRNRHDEFRHIHDEIWEYSINIRWKSLLLRHSAEGMLNVRSMAGGYLVGISWNSTHPSSSLYREFETDSFVALQTSWKFGRTR